MEDASSKRTATDWITVATILLVVIGFAVPVGYAYFWFVYLFANRWPTQEQMVSSGYAVILEAQQIDDLLGPAWHSLSNYQEPDIAEWFTTALFGGRYEMQMTVNVRIDRRTGQVIEVIGEPRFLLLEIDEIQEPASAGYRAAGQREFGSHEWHEVVASKGDFAVIGIQLNRDGPVPGFKRYVAYPRNGIRMSRRTAGVCAVIRAWKMNWRDSWSMVCGDPRNRLDITLRFQSNIFAPPSQASAAKARGFLTLFTPFAPIWNVPS